MNNREHVIMLLVGRTCSGKSTLAKTLCERTGYTQLISYTTRKKRNDQDNDHLFVTKDEYIMAKENGEIAAETEIAGNYYYATREQLYSCDVYTVDPAGKTILESMELPNIRFVTVYISCPDDERKLRSELRGDDKNAYRVRDFSERQQFRRFVSEEQWDYSLKNIDLPKAYSCLKWISQIENVWKNHMEDKAEL